LTENWGKTKRGSASTGKRSTRNSGGAWEREGRKKKTQSLEKTKAPLGRLKCPKAFTGNCKSERGESDGFGLGWWG